MCSFGSVRSIALIAVSVIFGPQVAAAGQTPAPVEQPATPGPTLTAFFAAFMTGVLAGRLPPSGVSDAMKAGFTPTKMDEVKTAFGMLGNFRELRFTKAERVQAYQRFHYVAIFEKGTQPVIFVIDSDRNIAGFFADDGQ